MKPYKTFTSPTIIKTAFFRTLLLPGIFACWQGLWIIIIKDFNFSLSNILFAILGIFMVGVLPCLVVYLVIGRAFHPVVLTEEGIRNGKTYFKWDEIGFVQTIETKMYRDKLPKPIVVVELICIAQYQDDYSFRRNDSRCIMIEKNLKNFEMLAKYTRRSSFAINSYIDRFFDVL